MIFVCQDCGEYLDSDTVFCGECGAEVVEVDMALSPVDDDVLEACDTVAECQNTTETSFEDVNYNNKAKVVLPIPIAPDACNECPHFLLEFNEGSSVFSVGYGSSLQFRLRPANQESLRAENVAVKVSRDNTLIVEKKFRVIPQRFRPITAYMNYTPGSGQEGADICFDIVLSYFINGKHYSFAENIIVDIYAENVPASKMVENLHVRIDNLQQEGAKYVGDQRDQKVCLIDSLGKSHDRNEIMSKLKKAELWHALPLFKYVGYASEDLFVPPIPFSLVKGQEFLLISPTGEKLYLHPSSMTLGRSRENSYCTRNMPKSDETWDQSTLRERNLKISGQHCRIAVDKSSIEVFDSNSSNGTFLDGKSVSTSGVKITDAGCYSLSLAPKSMSPNNFELVVKLIKGKEMNCSCLDASRACIVGNHLVMSGIMPLNKLCSSFPPNLYLVIKDSYWAITDLEQWTWLDKNGSVDKIQFSQI